MHTHLVCLEPVVRVTVSRIIIVTNAGEGVDLERDVDRTAEHCHLDRLSDGVLHHGVHGTGPVNGNDETMVLAVWQDGGLAEDVFGPLVVDHLLHVEDTGLGDSGTAERSGALTAHELLCHHVAGLLGLAEECVDLIHLVGRNLALGVEFEHVLGVGIMIAVQGLPVDDDILDLVDLGHGHHLIIGLPPTIVAEILHVLLHGLGGLRTGEDFGFTSLAATLSRFVGLCVITSLVGRFVAAGGRVGLTLLVTLLGGLGGKITIGVTLFFAHVLTTGTITLTSLRLLGRLLGLVVLHVVEQDLHHVEHVLP